MTPFRQHTVPTPPPKALGTSYPRTRDAPCKPSWKHSPARLNIRGAMANTFLLAQGKKIGKSLAEADLVATAREIMDKAKTTKREIVLPVDVVVAEKFEAHTPWRVVDADKVGTK